MVEPRLPKISAFVKEYSGNPDFVPSPDWIFIRKYSGDADSKRKNLRGHRDINEFSVNIPLNHNFEGGHIWFLRPTSEDRSDALAEPKVWPTENTTDYFMPRIHGGTAMIHDNTVSHGISDVLEGNKYTFILFYNMPPPGSDGVSASFSDKRTGHGDDTPMVDLVWISHEGKHVSVGDSSLALQCTNRASIIINLRLN